MFFHILGFQVFKDVNLHVFSKLACKRVAFTQQQRPWELSSMQVPGNGDVFTVCTAEVSKKNTSPYITSVVFCCSMLGFLALNNNNNNNNNNNKLSGAVSTKIHPIKLDWHHRCYIRNTANHLKDDNRSRAKKAMQTEWNTPLHQLLNRGCPGVWRACKWSLGTLLVLHQPTNSKDMLGGFYATSVHISGSHEGVMRLHKLLQHLMVSLLKDSQSKGMCIECEHELD